MAIPAEEAIALLRGSANSKIGRMNGWR